MIEIAGDELPFLAKNAKERAKIVRNSRFGNGLPPHPRFFVSMENKGVTDGDSVSIDSAGVNGRQLRPKQGKTRSCSASIDSKGVRGGAYFRAGIGKRRWERDKLRRPEHNLVYHT